MTKIQQLEFWLKLEENFLQYCNRKFERTHQYHSVQTDGLCGVVSQLAYEKIITIDEQMFFREQIRKESELLEKDSQDYIWESGDIKPRQEFIQRQILKHLKTA